MVNMIFPSAYKLGGILTFLFAKTYLTPGYTQGFSILIYHFEMEYILNRLTRPKYNVDCTLFINLKLINYFDYLKFVNNKPIFVSIQPFYTWIECISIFNYFNCVNGYYQINL